VSAGRSRRREETERTQKKAEKETKENERRQAGLELAAIKKKRSVFTVIYFGLFVAFVFGFFVLKNMVSDEGLFKWFIGGGLVIIGVLMGTICGWGVSGGTMGGTIGLIMVGATGDSIVIMVGGIVFGIVFDTKDGIGSRIQSGFGFGILGLAFDWFFIWLLTSLIGSIIFILLLFVSLCFLYAYLIRKGKFSISKELLNRAKE
jgi:hypothetical protein